MRNLVFGLLLAPASGFGQLRPWIDRSMGIQYKGDAGDLKTGDVIRSARGIRIDSSEAWKRALAGSGEMLDVEYARPSGGGGKASVARAKIDARIGYLIESVRPGSLAQRSELQPGDFVFQIDSQPVERTRSGGTGVRGGSSRGDSLQPMVAAAERMAIGDIETDVSEVTRYFTKPSVLRSRSRSPLAFFG